MKKLLLTALLACTLHAQVAYVTAHGKTFHDDKTCMSLAKSHNILTTDRATAEAHGLRECAICVHRHAGGTDKKKTASNESWAK